jgi:hypothetical protein
LLRLGPARRGSLLRQKFLEALGSKRLATAPRARIADYLFDAIVNGDRTRIGFDREPPADIAMRHAVAVPVELNAEILVDQRVGGIAIIVGDDGQRPQCLPLKAIYRPLAGFTMQALIGDSGQPLPDLAIDIVQVRGGFYAPSVAIGGGNPATFSGTPTRNEPKRAMMTASETRCIDRALAQLHSWERNLFFFLILFL